MLLLLLLSLLPFCSSFFFLLKWQGHGTRLHREREESKQPAYGLDAELKDKETQKLSQAEYIKLVEDAMNWIKAILGDAGIGTFPDNLKSGRVLCALVNKVAQL